MNIISVLILLSMFMVSLSQCDDQINIFSSSLVASSRDDGPREYRFTLKLANRVDLLFLLSEHRRPLVDGQLYPVTEYLVKVFAFGHYEVQAFRLKLTSQTPRKHASLLFDPSPQDWNQVQLKTLRVNNNCQQPSLFDLNVQANRVDSSSWFHIDALASFGLSPQFNLSYSMNMKVDSLWRSKSTGLSLDRCPPEWLWLNHSLVSEPNNSLFHFHSQVESGHSDCGASKDVSTVPLNINIKLHSELFPWANMELVQTFNLNPSKGGEWMHTHSPLFDLDVRGVWEAVQHGLKSKYKHQTFTKEALFDLTSLGKDVLGEWFPMSFVMKYEREAVASFPSIKHKVTYRSCPSGPLEQFNFSASNFIRLFALTCQFIFNSGIDWLLNDFLPIFGQFESSFIEAFNEFFNNEKNNKLLFELLGKMLIVGWFPFLYCPVMWLMWFLSAFRVRRWNLIIFFSYFCFLFYQIFLQVVERERNCSGKKISMPSSINNMLLMSFLLWFNAFLMIIFG